MMSKKIGEKKEHFSIRKLTVGAASVLIGTSLYLGGQKPASVHADSDDGSAKVTAVKTDQTEQKTSLGTEKDSKTLDTDAAKTGTTPAVKEEIKTGVNENKKSATSEETKKGVQSPEQKEPAKAEIGDKNQKDDLNVLSKQILNKQVNTKKSKGQDADSILDECLKESTIRRKIILHKIDGTTSIIDQLGIFYLGEKYVKGKDYNGENGHIQQLYYVISSKLNDSAPTNQKEVYTLNLSDSVNKDEQILKFINKYDSEIINFPGLNIKQPGYKAIRITYNIQEDQWDDINSPKNNWQVLFNAKEVPDQKITNKTVVDQIVVVRYLGSQPTSPSINPNPGTNPAPTEPTQPSPQTKPQPTVAPVHPEKPNEPGNVKPKPEKPAAPSHRTNGSKNNNSGSVKPKAQKSPSKAPVSKSVKRANARIPEAVHTTSQTVAAKAQTPAARPAAKATLPQTSENNSLSKAAILLGGAAAVIGLIGLAATRKHIF